MLGCVSSGFTDFLIRDYPPLTLGIVRLVVVRARGRLLVRLCLRYRLFGLIGLGRRGGGSGSCRRWRRRCLVRWSGPVRRLRLIPHLRSVGRLRSVGWLRLVRRLGLVSRLGFVGRLRLV